MNVELPAPRPAAAEGISPSRVNALFECGYRVAFQLDPAYSSLRRPSTFTALGNVAHAITEMAFKGRFNDVPDAEVRPALEAAWDNLVEREQGKLLSAWEPARPPEPASWRGYNLTRTRTLRRLVRAVAGHRAHTPVSPSEAPASKAPLGVEATLRDPDSGLYGTPDRVEADADGLRVIDLKSGLSQDGITDAQRRQLLLYAHLVHVDRGEWPTEIIIEDASGRRTAESVDPSAVGRLVDEVQEATDALQQAVDGDPSLLVSLAEPSDENCRWCPFRVVCGPYWDALDSAWGHGAALGRIQSITRVGDTTSVALTVISPAESAGDRWTVFGLAAPPSQGATYFSVADADRTANPSDLRARWSTMTWSL